MYIAIHKKIIPATLIYATLKPDNIPKVIKIPRIWGMNYLCGMRVLLVFCFILAAILRGLADPFVLFEENGKKGIKDETGKVIIPASFEALGWSDGHFSVIGRVTGYKIKNRWGLIDLQKHYITPADFESITYPGGDRFVVSRKINPFTVKFGCIDLTGKITVPLQYDRITVNGLRAIVLIKNGASYETGVIDLNDKGIIPMRYIQIRPLGTLRYAVENSSHRTALFSEAGTQLTDFIIDSISPYHHGLAIVYENYSQGVIDREGKIKVEPGYREVRMISPDSMVAKAFDEWAILDFRNRVLRKIKADNLEYSGDENFRISISGKEGLLDDSLNTLIPATFDFIGPPDHHHRVVGIQKKYGVIGKNNVSLMPIAFDSVVLENNFIRTAKKISGKWSWSLYDTFGVCKTRSPFDFIDRSRGKYFPARRRGYWGVVNRYGDELIPCVYDSLLEIQGDLLSVRFHGQYGIINMEDQWILQPQATRITLVNQDCYLEKSGSTFFLRDFHGGTIYFTGNPLRIGRDFLEESLSDKSTRRLNFKGQEIENEVALPEGTEKIFGEREGLIGIQKDGKFGFVDTLGRLRIANRYDSIGSFHEGLAAMKLIGKWGFINTRDNITIQPNYEKVQAFINGESIVCQSGKMGIINNQGIVVLPCRYDLITRLPDNYFILKTSGLCGLADPKGYVLIEPRFETLVDLGNGSVLAGREGKFGILTRQGMSTIPMIYDKLTIRENGTSFLGLKKSPWKEFKLD
jgi:WG containing repeat